MNTPKSLLFLAAVAVFALGAERTLAADLEDHEMIGYEQILKELGSTPSGSTRGSAKIESDPFANVMIHAGVGMVSTFGQANAPQGKINYSQSGVQAVLGIDLFSPNWIAEGSARSFARADYDNAHLALREFDIKFLYKDNISRAIGYRMGLGVAARYMTVEMMGERTDYTTPASVIGGGMDLNFNKHVSAGIDISARNTMVAETGDRNSMDAAVRLDAHF